MELILGEDYTLTHKFKSASKILDADIFGSITFLNKKLTGTVLIDYSTLGGDYTGKDDILLHRITSDLSGTRTIYWEDIRDIPSDFPVRTHTHKNSEIHDMDDVVDAINKITAVLLGDDRPSHRHYINDVDGLQEALESKVANDSYIQLYPVYPAILVSGGLHYKLSFPSIFKETNLYMPIFVSSDTFSFYLRIAGLVETEQSIGTGWKHISAFTDGLEYLQSISVSYDENNKPTVYLSFNERLSSDLKATIPYVTYTEKITELLKGAYQWELTTDTRGTTIVPDSYSTGTEYTNIEDRLRKIRLNTLLEESLYVIV